MGSQNTYILGTCFPVNGPGTSAHEGTSNCCAHGLTGPKAWILAKLDRDDMALQTLGN